MFCEGRAANNSETLSRASHRRKFNEAGFFRALGALAKERGSLAKLSLNAHSLLSRLFDLDGGSDGLFVDLVEEEGSWGADF